MEMIYRVSKKARDEHGQILFDVLLIESNQERTVEEDLTYHEAENYCAAKMRKDDRFELDLYGEITYTYGQPEFVGMVERLRHERKQSQGDRRTPLPGGI